MALWESTLTSSFKGDFFYLLDAILLIEQESGHWVKTARRRSLGFASDKIGSENQRRKKLRKFSVETRTHNKLPHSTTMELESLMPEPHSKIILWYRCYAHSSKLLGMALGMKHFGEWLERMRNDQALAQTTNYHMSHPKWLLCSLEILQAPGCLVTPL
jgi:hypothetical protein